VRLPLQPAASSVLAVQAADSTTGMLPPSTAETTPVERTAREASSSLPQVLVVEDNLVNQKVAQLMLERIGCAVDLAIDGNAAVASAARKTYSLILMDLSMPGMDGLEATRLIRAGTGPNANTPIVAVTANALSEDRDECMRLGMNGFLTKPLLLGTLLETVQRFADPAQTAEAFSTAQVGAANDTDNRPSGP
jgi:CheY-like chemotaxis protein